MSPKTKNITKQDLASWGKMAVAVIPVLGAIVGATWHLSASQANTQRDLNEIKPMIQKVTELEKLVPVVNHVTWSLNKLSDAAEDVTKELAVDKQRWITYERDHAEMKERIERLEDR